MICGFLTAAIINATWLGNSHLVNSDEHDNDHSPSSSPANTLPRVLSCPCAEHLIAQLRGDAAGLIKPVVHRRQDLKPSQCMDSAALRQAATLEISGRLWSKSGVV